jgi:UDP-N-acetylglucosamine acyltransferase
MPTIHPTSIIDPSAELAESVVIGPYCVVGPHVAIGEGTVLHNHVTIQCNAVVGASNSLYPYSVVAGDPQDRKYHGEHTTLTIGDRNTIREHVTIHRGTGNGGGTTSIGNGNLFMGGVHIAHDCILGDEITIANYAMLAGHIRIEDGVNIGGGAGIHHFATVGTCAFVAAMARVPKDVPPYMIVEGSPAEVRAINSIALVRRGFAPDHIDAIKDAYKRLYRDNGSAMADKLDDLRREYVDVPAVIRLCDALAASAEGVHGRAMEVMRPDNKRLAPIA